MAAASRLSSRRRGQEQYADLARLRWMSRATTNPSPPLFPLPQTSVTSCLSPDRIVVPAPQRGLAGSFHKDRYGNTRIGDSPAIKRLHLGGGHDFDGRTRCAHGDRMSDRMRRG